jgi:hypothetical protein
MITTLCILGWILGASVTCGLLVLLDNLCIIQSETAEGCIRASLVGWPLILLCLLLGIPIVIIVVLWVEFWNLFR